MPRIPYFDISQAPEELRQMLATRRPLNIYRMLPHAGPAAIGFLRLGQALLNQNALDSRLRELAVLRVGLLSGAGYEVHQHRRVAREVGVPDDKLAGLEAGPEAPCFDDLERAVLRFTDDVVLNVKAGQALYDDVAARLSEQQCAELIVLIGFYMMVCRFLENLEVEIEDIVPAAPSAGA